MNLCYVDVELHIKLPKLLIFSHNVNKHEQCGNLKVSGNEISNFQPGEMHQEGL